MKGCLALVALAAAAFIAVQVCRLPDALDVFDDASRWDGNRGSPRGAPG